MRQVGLCRHRGARSPRCRISRSQSTSANAVFVGSFLKAARKHGWDIIGVDLGDDPRPLWMGDSSLGNATWPAVQHEVGTRDISSGRPLRLGSHWRLNERRNETMRDTSGRDNLCSWLLKVDVLVAWCRHRPTRGKRVMTVNDTWLRAFGRVHECHRATVACRLRE